MPEVDMHTLAACLQALEKALQHNRLVASSQTVNPHAYAESDRMYEQALDKLIRLYRAEERKGRAPVPLKQLVKHRPRKR